MSYRCNIIVAQLPADRFRGKSIMAASTNTICKPIYLIDETQARKFDQKTLSSRDKERLKSDARLVYTLSIKPNKK